MPMRVYCKLMAIFLSALMLCQCEKMVEGHALKKNSNQATPFTMPTTAYLAMAKNQPLRSRQALFILAAGRAIYDGQWQEGEHILSQTSELTPVEAAEKNILLAKIAFIRSQPQKTIQYLAHIRNPQIVSAFYQVQYHELLANAFQMQGKPSEALVERMKLESILPDEPSRSNNRKLIWLTLTTLSSPDLNAMAAEATPRSELDGWTQLALIPRRYGDNGPQMLEALMAWAGHHPQHPARLMLPGSLEAFQDKIFAPPKRIALLLPMSGALSGPGGAIRDGFMAALAQSPERGDIGVKFYDTHLGAVDSLYRQAIADGAQFVVGPLSKQEVAQIGNMAHPVPTLLLNDVNKIYPDGAYQFGLSPPNEAKQVAAVASRRGYRRALIIAPEGVWGEDITSAFVKQWQGNGGKVVDIYRYQPQTDLQQGIRQLLHASDAKTQGEGPKRREDFDMIFLVAYPSKARQIMPTLRYYFVGNTPVYATSSVYSGSQNSQQDRDLDGIQFCDMPWVFRHQMGNRNWPEQLNSYNRLYALGMDSYALTKKLNQLMIFPAIGLSEQSGILYLNSDHVVGRVLTWGQFRQGIAEEYRESRSKS